MEGKVESNGGKVVGSSNGRGSSGGKQERGRVIRCGKHKENERKVKSGKRWEEGERITLKY